jgi:leukotriene-A4 hydrolase
MSFSPLYAQPSAPQDRDLATLSNYLDILVTHTDLEWTIDWDQKLIGGKAILTLTASKEVDTAVLDTSFLDIRDVSVEGQKAVRDMAVAADKKQTTDKSTGLEAR